MTEKRVLFLAHAEARRRAMAAVADAPDGYRVTVEPPKRSLEQNSRMWAMLADVSRQVEWYGKHLTPAAWKCVFSASLKKQDVVPGLHGDFVVLGQSTSRMTKREMGDLMTLMEAFGAERGVTWSDPTMYQPEAAEA